MSKIKLVLALLFFISSFDAAKAQSWYEMKSASWTLKQIQDSFYRSKNRIEKEERKDEKEKDGKEKGEVAEEGYIQFKRWEAFWQRRMKPEDHFPSSSATYDAWEEYTKNHQQFSHRGQSLANWTFHGSETSDGGYSGIGKTNCIAFHPSDLNTFWVGTAYGGLWKTTDGGTTWSTNPGGMTNSGINDIAVNPLTPTIMYLVTAENYGGITRSTGVLKSIDGGNTWNATTLVYPASDNIRFRKIIINPANPDILLVAASNGIWKTIDGGITWIRSRTGSYHDIKFNPGAPSIAYASTYINSGGGYSATIYRSTNTGSSWSSVFTQAGAGYTILAVTPNNPSLVLTASVDNQGGLFNLCRSTNDGASFAPFFVGGTTNNLMAYNENGSGSGGQGSYDLTLTINPANQNDVWLGGINTWNSINQGVQWNIKSHWYGANGIPAVHADKHFHIFSPLLPNTIFECNDGGIYKSSNSGVSWTDLTNGLSISQIYFISVANTATDQVICGLQDNGTKYLVNQAWSDVYGGDGFKCIIDYADTSILYASIYSGNVYKSTDKGFSWNSIADDQGTGVNAPSSFYTNYTMHPTNHNTLLIGKGQVYQTTNAGNSWSQLGTLLNAQVDYNWAITYAPSDPQVIYAANYTDLYKTTNGGTTWTTLLNPAGYGSSIAVDPLNSQRVWFAYSYASGAGSVYQSTDGGATMTDITGSIPADVAVNCIIYENGSNDGLYIGTDIGVFYRNSTMTDWLYYNDGLPNIVVNDLQINYSTGKLLAGTYGRGLWNTDLYNALPLTLLEFTAKAINKTSSLQWKTTNELNTGRFIIERSFDAAAWSALGNVTASNTSGNHSYSFTDNEPFNGVNYYRLKMLDKDGKFTYSPVKTVNFKTGNESITVIPNPSRDFTNIVFNKEVSNASITLFDEHGRKLFADTYKGDATNIYRLDTKKFATGIYVLKVNGSEINASERLMIQK